MDLSHIMRFEVESFLNEVPMGTKVVLFNQERITQEEALEIVQADGCSPYVLSISMRQWEGLFNNRPPEDLANGSA